MRRNPWDLYDALIDAVDADLRVDDYIAGVRWSFVRSGEMLGMSSNIPGHSGPTSHRGPIIGKPLRDVCAMVKSWDFDEASIGAAALTCFYNTWDKVDALGGLDGIDVTFANPAERTKKEAFVTYADEVAGRKVAVVGHFPHIEKRFGSICDLTVLERAPRMGDYPDSACEYVVPEQDCVFITGMTLINKTLPRLLELASPTCKVSLVGPTVPVSTSLFAAGADNLSSLCVTDRVQAADFARRAARLDIFEAGVMVSVDKVG